MKTAVVLCFCVHFAVCRDYYVGMFKRDDLLVASDTLYKERRPFSKAVAEYGRIFQCTITYFRIVDRLGVGTGPIVKVTRGGLQKKYVVMRITSSYDLPLSVNIYVGCENKYNFTRSTYIVRPTRPTRPTTTKKTDAAKGNDTDTAKPDDEKTDGDAPAPEPVPEGADAPADAPADDPADAPADTTPEAPPEQPQTPDK